jgi:hypothetical protein
MAQVLVAGQMIKFAALFVVLKTIITFVKVGRVTSEGQMRIARLLCILRARFVGHRLTAPIMEKTIFVRVNHRGAVFTIRIMEICRRSRGRIMRASTL